MNCSLELTLTPLNEGYKEAIKKFIKSLRATGHRVIENPLSTQIYGDYDALMTTLVPLIKKTFVEEDAVVLHLKFVKGDRSDYEPDF